MNTRLFITCAVVFLLLGSTAQKGNTQTPYAGMDILTTDIYYAARNLSANWNSVNRIFYGKSNVWWYVRYQNGMTAYRSFCVSFPPNAVLNYFTLAGGDCTAFYIDDRGNHWRLCYNPAQIANYARNFGQITGMGYMTPNGQWVSVLSYYDYRNTTPLYPWERRN